MAINNIAINSLLKISNDFSIRANNINKSFTNQGQNISLSNEVVQATNDKNNYYLETKVISAQDFMVKSLLDMKV